MRVRIGWSTAADGAAGRFVGVAEDVGLGGPAVAGDAAADEGGGYGGAAAVGSAAELGTGFGSWPAAAGIAAEMGTGFGRWAAAAGIAAEVGFGGIIGDGTSRKLRSGSVDDEGILEKGKMDS